MQLFFYLSHIDEAYRAWDLEVPPGIKGTQT